MQISKSSSRRSAHQEPVIGGMSLGDKAALPAVASRPSAADLTVAIVLAMSDAVVDCLRLFDPSK
jgi:hypothetical protein